jgi:hopanoid C-3 methylase HpnR
MKILGVHPSALMYSRIFLRLEPLGLELIGEALRRAGHDVRLLDLQVESHNDLYRAIRNWRPDAVAFSLNYLANIPEVVDLAKAIRTILPRCFVFAGGHSASFVARDVIRHAEGALDCVLTGEGEAAAAELIEASRDGVAGIAHVPGVVTDGAPGTPPRFVRGLDDLAPARDLLRHRNRYFIGVLDPCASVEFSRGCPWDCVFCSAWTFYGRSYRRVSPERAVEDLARIREPGVFIVDDVAFIHGEHGREIGEAVAHKGIRKEYYLETRGDVLLRNKDVFRLWKSLGMRYMFLGLEAIDAEGLKRYRKRISSTANFEALEFARSLGIKVAINIIADPGWDREQFRVIREFCLDIPEIVNISIATPYPGTELWHTESRRLTTRDYRLFDIQHAVVPTQLPLDEFYKEVVSTQNVLNRKHLGWNAIRAVGGIAARRLLHGQTNFVKMIWKFNSVYNPNLQIADHQRPVAYQIRVPPGGGVHIDEKDLCVYPPRGHSGRDIDESTERFVNGQRMRAGAADR